MDLSTVLLLLTALALAVFAVRLVRAPARQVLDWWITFALVGIVSWLGWTFVPHNAGWVAFGALCAFVFAPLRIDRAAQRSARAGRDARALLLARIAALLHPFGAIGARPVAIGTLARIRATGDVDPSDLARLGAADDPVLTEWYRLVALNAAADHEAVRAALAIPARRLRMLQLGLGAAWVRAVAMTGTRAEVVEAIEEVERVDRTLDEPDRRALLALEACAALGEVEGVRALSAHVESGLPPGSIARAVAAAQLARGDRGSARETIVEALRDPGLDAGVRRALERLRAKVHEPRGDAPTETVERRARELVERLVQEARASAVLAPIAEGTRSPTWATWAIALAIVAWYAVVALRGDPMNAGHLARMGGLVLPIDGVEGVLRVVTSTFVHYGIVHLLFNLYALVAFGRFVESFYGKGRLLAIWLAATFTSGLGVAWTSDPAKPQVLVGASGAIFGLGGALVAAVGLRADLRRSRRGREELRAFAILVGLQFVFDRMVPGISGTAHVCGLIGGVLAGAIVVPRANPPQTSPR